MPRPTTKDELMRIETYLYKLQDRLDQTLAAQDKALASHGEAIEELNRRTFKLNVEIEGLKPEAERRALITAALETRVEKLEQASQPAPRPETEITRRIKAASPRREDPFQSQLEEERRRRMNAEDKAGSDE